MTNQTELSFVFIRAGSHTYYGPSPDCIPDGPFKDAVAAVFFVKREFDSAVKVKADSEAALAAVEAERLRVAQQNMDKKLKAATAGDDKSPAIQPLPQTDDAETDVEVATQAVEDAAVFFGAAVDRAYKVFESTDADGLRQQVVAVAEAAERRAAEAQRQYDSAVKDLRNCATFAEVLHPDFLNTKRGSGFSAYRESTSADIIKRVVDSYAYRQDLDLTPITNLRAALRGE